MQFHVISFEGPDAYSKVGGLATRVNGLVEALATMDFQVHLWFVGDPDLPGHETHENLHLHRWCQWISKHHRSGDVYAAEHAKADDFARSLAPYMVHGLLGKHLRDGGRAIVMAEEWQTSNTVLNLDWLLRREGLRKRVTLFWTANNIFGFDQIDWKRLAQAAKIATVSRYMKSQMQPYGVDPVVIPNGLSPDAYLPPDRAATAFMRSRFRDRTVITKMARWDPDKRWLESIEIISDLKRRGMRPLFIARGGTEAYGKRVMAAARKARLRVVERFNSHGSIASEIRALQYLEDADVVNLRSHVEPDVRRILFRASDVVLANSVHEPFGLVGLEAMAAGGIACTGYSGEDYVVPGRNALVLQTGDAREFVELYKPLADNAAKARGMRRAGRSTAKQYAWPQVIERNLMPQLELARISGC